MVKMPKICVVMLKAMLSMKSQQLRFLISASFKHFKIVQKTSFPVFFRFEMALLKNLLKVKIDRHFKKVYTSFLTFNFSLH